MQSIPSHHRGWELDTHVVMPDHVHVVLFAGDRAGQVRPNDRAGQVRPLHDVVGAFKARASRRAGRTLWQRGYHDRIIRNETELNALREYIATNPLRWSLRNEGPDRSGPYGICRASDPFGHRPHMSCRGRPVRPVQASIVRAPWR